MPPIKRQRVSEWIKKQKPSICCLQESHFRPKVTSGFKVRGWKTIFHACGHQRKAGVSILIWDPFDFEPKSIIRDEEGHYIIFKKSVQQEDLTILEFFLFDREITSRQRGRQRDGGEAGSLMRRVPGVGLDPRTLRSWPEPKADA